MAKTLRTAKTVALLYLYSQHTLCILSAYSMYTISTFSGYSQCTHRIFSEHSGFFNTWNFLQSYKNSVLAFKWHQINDIWLNFLNYWDIRLYLSSWKPPFLLNWILVDFKFQTIARSNEFQIFLGSADSQDFSDFKDVPKMPKEGQIKPWNMYL